MRLYYLLTLSLAAFCSVSSAVDPTVEAFNAALGSFMDQFNACKALDFEPPVDNVDTFFGDIERHLVVLMEKGEKMTCAEANYSHKNLNSAITRFDPFVAEIPDPNKAPVVALMKSGEQLLLALKTLAEWICVREALGIGSPFSPLRKEP